MRVWKAIVASVVLLALGTTYAGGPDDYLAGAHLVISGTCDYQGDDLPCAVYRKEDVTYLVFAENDSDRLDIILIYLVRKGALMPYQPSDSTLLWSKKEKGVWT